MRKVLGNLGIVGGLFCMYLGILLFVSNTSGNMAVKNASYIAPVEAKLHFYEDDAGTHKYGDVQHTTNNNIKIYKANNQHWSSQNYPVKDKYKTVKVIQDQDKVAAPSKILEATVTITRNSH